MPDMVLSGVSSGYAVLSPSGDQTGMRDAANIMVAVTSLPSSGGVVRLNPIGTWYIRGGQIIINASGVYIDAPACYIVAVGSGDTFRMFDSSTPSSRTTLGGGVTGRPYIDGTLAGSTSSGLHFGDISTPKIDLISKNFAAPSSAGLLLDNAYFWTEEADIRAIVGNCTQQVVYQDSAGTNSFGYGKYDFTLDGATNQQDGVVISEGAFVYHASLRMRGNFAAGAAATSAAALKIIGQNSSSQASALVANRLDVQVECGTGANAPKTIIMDTAPFCEASQNYGILDFAHGAGSFAPSTVLDTQFSFNGVVEGDSNLSGAKTWVNVFSPVVYRNKNTGSSGATPGIPTEVGDFFQLLLSANATISLNPASYGGHTLGVPQRVTIVITQAAGGGFTVTWPHTVTPTTATPTVLWVGGGAPVMTAAANAVDMYELSTVDGATWIGRATQNVS